MRRLTWMALAWAGTGCMAEVATELTGAREEAPAEPPPDIADVELPPDDAWSERTVLRGSAGNVTDGYFSPQHAILLPTGKILLAGFVRPEWEGTDANTVFVGPPLVAVFDPPPPGEDLPPELTLQPLREAVDAPFGTRVERGWWETWNRTDSLFCSGHTFLEDGRVFFAGGNRSEWRDGDAVPEVTGLPYGMTLDPDTLDFARSPDMVGISSFHPDARRWYPSVVRLSDGRVLVAPGFYAFWPTQQYLQTDFNMTVELYDPATESYSLVSTHPLDPFATWNAPRTPLELIPSPYTHVYELPVPLDDGSDVLMLGVAGIPVGLDLDAREYHERWDRARPGFVTFGAASARLPLREESEYEPGAVAFVGGACDGPAPDDWRLTPEYHFDVYEPGRAEWRPSIDMGVGRHHATLTQLPDGRLLVFGGYDDCLEDPPDELGRAQIVDPLRGLDMRWGTSQVREVIDGRDEPEVHGYHVVSLLLPDGRVFVAGGRHGEQIERPTARLYTPSYGMADRPIITEAPDRIALGGTFVLRTEGARLAEVALIGLGSMTHAIDAHQRYVQLAIESSGLGVATVRLPGDARTLPPGPYMLVAVDEHRAPSEARIVRVERP